MKIKSKIFSLTIGSILLTVIIICSAISIYKSTISTDISAQLSEKLFTISSNEISNSTRDFYNMCQLQDNLLHKILDVSLGYAEQRVHSSGNFSLGKKTVSWKASNQFTRESSEINLPEFLLGEKWLGQNYSFEQDSPLVDNVLKNTGVTCTVFQRMNKAGDMLRICTNIRQKDGQRAIGTYIPAINPDGTPNDVVESIIKGEAHFSRAYVVNAWYITIYKPIKDNSGNVIGTLYVGIKQNTAKEFGEIVSSFNLHGSSYAAVINGFNSKEFRGQAIYHSRKDEIGKNYFELTDIHNKDVFTDLATEAGKQTAGNPVLLDTTLKIQPDGAATEFILSAAYFKPFDWIILIASEKRNFNSLISYVTSALDNILFLSITSGIFIIIIGTLAAWYITRGIIRPIIKAVDVARAIEQGDIELRMNITSKDEVGELAEAIDHMLARLQGNTAITRLVAEGDLTAEVNIASERDTFGKALSTMQENLNNIIAQTDSTVAHTAEAALQINNAAHNLSQNTIESAKDIDIISNKISEMEEKANLNSAHSASANDLTWKALTAAQESNSKMGSMISAMEEIKESSTDITNIIHTIDAIAFQTNLLALNAAVESARAGQHGKGFAVVANEVKSLANRSASAAHETEQLIRESNDKIIRGTAIAEEAQNALNIIVGIIDDIYKINKNVAQASKEQNESISYINRKIEEINRVLHHNSTSAEETESASSSLSEKAATLKKLLHYFKYKA